MATQIIEDVYNGRDNTIDLLLTEDGVSINHDSITRVQLKLNNTADTVIDSETSPGVFDWSQGKLIISLGNEGVPVGSYNADLYIFDGTNTNGVKWKPKLGLRVSSEA
jgi:hypothetical protein